MQVDAESCTLTGQGLVSERMPFFFFLCYRVVSWELANLRLNSPVIEMVENSELRDYHNQ